MTEIYAYYAGVDVNTPFKSKGQDKLSLALVFQDEDFIEINRAYSGREYFCKQDIGCPLYNHNYARSNKRSVDKYNSLYGIGNWKIKWFVSENHFLHSTLNQRGKKDMKIASLKPLIISTFLSKHVGVENKVFTKEFVDFARVEIGYEGSDDSLGRLFRTAVSQVRRSGLVGDKYILVAKDSRDGGYWLTNEHEEIESWKSDTRSHIESMQLTLSKVEEAQKLLP